MNLTYLRDRWTMVLEEGVLIVEDWDPRSANVHDNAAVVGSITIGIEEESRLLDALERLQDLGTYDLTDRNYDGTWTFQFTGPMKMFATGKDMPPELQDFLTIVIDAADAQGCGPISEHLNRFLDIRDENLGEAYIAITRGELEGPVSRETAMAIAKDAARDEMFSRARDAMMMLYERLLRQVGYGDIVDAWERGRAQTPGRFFLRVPDIPTLYRQALCMLKHSTSSILLPHLIRNSDR